MKKRDPTEQLEASKSSNKDLFSNLLDETKGFKYKITLKVTLKKYKPNEEILYKIDSWISDGSGWIVELIKAQYINISTYRSLSRSSYVKLPVELRSQKED